MRRASEREIVSPRRNFWTAQGARGRSDWKRRSEPTNARAVSASSFQSGGVAHWLLVGGGGGQPLRRGFRRAALASLVQGWSLAASSSASTTRGLLRPVGKTGHVFLPTLACRRSRARRLLCTRTVHKPCCTERLSFTAALSCLSAETPALCETALCSAAPQTPLPRACALPFADRAQASVGPKATSAHRRPQASHHALPPSSSSVSSMSDDEARRRRKRRSRRPVKKKKRKRRVAIDQ